MVGWSKGVLPSTAPPQNVFPLKEEMAPVVAAEDENAAKRPQIGTKAVALIVGPDLWCHVGRRARPARRVVVALRILREQGRQPEVRQFPEEAAAPLTDSKNVVWLEVPVEDRLGPEVVEVAQGEGEVSKASPDAVLLEAHGVRLQRLPHHKVGEGSSVGVLHDDTQLPIPVLQEETPQPDDVLAVQLHQGDHLLHGLLVKVLDPLHSTSHSSNLFLKHFPKSSLAEQAHAWAKDGRRMC